MHASFNDLYSRCSVTTARKNQLERIIYAAPALRTHTQSTCSIHLDACYASSMSLDARHSRTFCQGCGSGARAYHKPSRSQLIMAAAADTAVLSHRLQIKAEGYTGCRRYFRQGGTASANAELCGRRQVTQYIRRTLCGRQNVSSAHASAPTYHLRFPGD